MCQGVSPILSLLSTTHAVQRIGSIVTTTLETNKSVSIINRITFSYSFSLFMTSSVNLFFFFFVLQSVNFPPSIFLFYFSFNNLTFSLVNLSLIFPSSISLTFSSINLSLFYFHSINVSFILLPFILLFFSFYEFLRQSLFPSIVRFLFFLRSIFLSHFSFFNLFLPWIFLSIFSSVNISFILLHPLFYSPSISPFFLPLNFFKIVFLPPIFFCFSYLIFLFSSLSLSFFPLALLFIFSPIYLFLFFFFPPLSLFAIPFLFLCHILPRHSLKSGGSNPSAEMQSAYSTVAASY